MECVPQPLIGGIEHIISGLELTGIKYLVISSVYKKNHPPHKQCFSSLILTVDSLFRCTDKK
jgi:hypothetical protein